jgi:very-short-patch-repair endonuclease
MRNKRKKLATYGSKAKKKQDKKLTEHNDLGYLEDLAHLYKLGAISESKRDWIETTMLGLRDKANCYEKAFAKYLMDKKLKFIHQAPFIFSGKIYFADFYLPDHHLIVEIDGIYHQGISQYKYDRFRDQCFNGHKLSVIRIPNDAVMDAKAMQLLLSPAIK